MKDSANLLPHGWCWVKLGDLCNLINGDRGKNYPSKGAFVEQGVPFINAGHLVDGEISLSAMNYITEEHFNRLGGGKIRADDLLYCLRGSLGKSAVVRHLDRGAIASSLVIIRPNECSSSTFLLFYVTSPQGKAEILRFDNGSAQPNLSARSVANFDAPLPPLNEQRRIVAKLEALQARSRRARESLEAIPPLLEKFRQSVLAAAFRGDLSAEWRKQHPDVEPASELLKRIRIERRRKWEEAELAKMRAKGKEPKDDRWKAKYKEPEPVDESGLPELPEGWCWVSFDTLLYGIDAGKNLRCVERPPANDEAGIVKVSAVSWGEFAEEESKTTSRERELAPSTQIQPGDFLFSRANTIELVGACVVVRTVTKRLYLSDKILRLRMPSHLKPWVLRFLRTSVGRQQLEGKSSGNQLSMRNIPQGRLREIAVPVGPPEEMDAVIDVFDRHDLQLRTVRHAVIRAARRIELMEGSTLAAAFRGDLVPQDATDEPAAVLLDRIRAERSEVSHGKVKMGRRGQGQIEPA